MLPSKMGHACTSSFFGKTNSNNHKSLDDAFKSCLKRNDHSPFKANCQRHLASLHSWSIRWPVPVPLNILNARLSIKFNGGTKLLKRVENIEKTFEYNRVDKTLSYLRSTCKNTCLLFKNHTSYTLSKQTLKTIWNIFSKRYTPL